MDDLEKRIQNEATQLTYYKCATRGCPHRNIPKQIREFTATGKPCFARAILCDSADGCNKPWTRMRKTTIAE